MDSRRITALRDMTPTLPMHDRAQVRERIRSACFLLALILAILRPVRSFAECQVTGYTADGGEVIVCTGTDSAGVVGSAGSDNITVTSGAEVGKASQVSVNSSATADVATIDTKAGSDQVINEGNVSATAGALALPVLLIPSDATATAVGAKTGDGSDTISNSSTISATSVAAASTYPDPLFQFNSATTMATAEGIDAGNGNNDIVNTGTVTISASSNTALTEIHLAPSGSATIVPPSATAVASGIGGGGGTDQITNNGSVGVTATSTVSGGKVQLLVSGATDADAGLTADAIVTGILLTGGGQITNNGTISTTATSSATGWQGSVDILDQSTASTTITPHAVSTGILGGTGYCNITNAGTISATAGTSATLPAAEVNVVDMGVGGAGIGTEENPMQARATGIDAGAGGGQIVNTAGGTINALATSSANMENVVLSLYDFTIRSDIQKDAGSIASYVDATATGINGGSGNEQITNDGDISATAKSSVLSVGVGVGVEGVPSGFSSFSPDFYKPLFTPDDATITSTANATGLRAGDGNDTIVNTGSITVYAGPTDNNTPNALATGVTLSLPVLELTGLSDSLGKWANLIDYPPAIAVASAGTSSTATATGIYAGNGNDTITNAANPGDAISVTAVSLATSDSASVTVQNVKDEGGTGWHTNLDMALAKANTTASAVATGIQAGKGNDNIFNDGALNVSANATAIGNGVSVQAVLLKGMAENGWAVALGATLTDLETQAAATATGIAGGDGNNYIYNLGQLNVDTETVTNSLSADVSVQGQITGLGGGITLANTSTTSTASSTGVSVGNGSEQIFNGIGSADSGILHAYANADAYSESFTVTVQRASTGVEVGGALAIGSTTATATAMGVAGGEGNDVISNNAYGSIDVNATATANNFSAAVTVQAGVKGLGAGVALTDMTTTTTASATGISGGGGDDSIVNDAFSTLKSYAVSNAYAESFSVNVQGQSTGLVLGGALALGSATATATATGIDGGAGDNQIYNAGTIDANSSATTNNLGVGVGVQGSVSGVGLGVAFTDASSTAVATATGVTGGLGDNLIYNAPNGTIKAYADANSYAELFSVNVQGNSTGIVLGGALVLANSTATAAATGIAGGTGNNTLTNDAYGTVDVNASATANSLACSVAVQGAVEGFGGQAALTDASTFSTATATGIAGGNNQNLITNGTGAILNAEAAANAYAESISVSVQGEATGVTLSGSLARGETIPTATAIGISGGAGAATITNDGSMNVQAKTDSTSVAVAARAVGVIEGISVGASLTDTSTAATATATGIDGGAGDDTITNNGSIVTNTDSTLRAASVSVDFGGIPIGVSVGAALSKASVNATGTAKGIDGGTGNDTITNSSNGVIDVNSTAQSTSTAVSISANVIGTAWTDTSASTSTLAVGIDGNEGKDSIYNLGAINAGSSSTANVANVSVNLLGATPVSGWTSAIASSVGINGGTGGSLVENYQAVSATSTATTNATGVAVQVAGYSDMNLTNNAVASSTCIMGGGAANTIINEENGSIQAAATASGDATAVDINLLGYSTGNGQSTATATVKGIDGGGGANTITNLGSITGTATATANAKSYDIQLAGGADATAGTEATATAIGISAGKGDDVIGNGGTISLTSRSTLTATSRSLQIAGKGNADANSTASAFAIGIDGGDGNNTITNDTAGSISVSSSASADAGGITALLLGVAGASATTTSLASSTGLKGGAGQDTMINNGTLNVQAASTTSATSGTLSLIGLPSGDGLTTAIAVGIDAGAGNNYVLNTGSITVGSVPDNNHPMAYANVGAASMSVLDIASASIGAGSQATGIMCGLGDDTVINEGTITVGSDYWMTKANGLGFSVTFLGLTSAGAQADTTSTGIDGGDGSNNLINDTSGVVTVKASSYAYTNGSANSLIGSNAAYTTSTSTATATGIAGGNDNDLIVDNGAIDVSAEAWGDSNSNGYVFAGSPTSDSSATANAGVYGIQSKEGNDLVTNSGTINVRALAETSPYSYANSDFDKTYSTAEAYSHSTAVGILAGNGSSTLINTTTGAITVTATANSYDPSDNVAVANSDENATTTASSLTADAVGVQAGNGNNSIINSGVITVTSEMNASAHASASSTEYTAYATSYAGGSAGSAGIEVGNGNNAITNGGTLNITAAATAKGLSDYPSDHLDQATAYAGEGNAPLTSNAIGITAGNGANSIENDSSIIVSSSVTADAQAKSSTVTTDTYSWAYAGGDAEAAGIAVGSGDNTISNYGAMTVGATGGAYALGQSDNYGYAYIGGTGGSPGITAESVGISAGDGANVISNYGTLNSNATAVLASTVTTGDDGQDSLVSSNATATGIRAGNGNNTITNVGTISAVALTISNATATGIRVGSGNNTITNLGTIRAVEENVYSLFPEGSAVGIQTGDGNNVIINNGTITTARENMFFSKDLGTAILTGAGNNQVYLGDGSVTVGSIDLGSGDDWLTVMGTPLVTGNVSGGSGTNTLVFNGAGSIGFAPVEFENAIKQGAGTYSVSSLPTMQRVEVDEGTLQVNSDYAMGKDSSFQTNVNGDGSHGQLKVDGTAQLDGNLNVIKGPGVYTNGMRYDILQADTLEGAFGTETLPENEPLLSFQTVTYPDRVEVEALAKSFTTVANNFLQKEIAEQLDRIAPNATGDMSMVLGTFQSLSKPDFDTAFASLSPDSYNASTGISLSSAEQYVKTIEQRMHSLRAALKFSASETRPRYGVWFLGSAQRGDQDSEDGFTGYGYHHDGWTLGADRFLNDHALLGISLGVSRADIDFDNGMGGSDIDAVIGSLYFSWFNEKYYLDASLAYGGQDYDNTRMVTIGTIERSATSHHDGSTLSGYLEGGYNFSFGRSMLGPFAALNYIRLDEDGFSESGADSLDLNVDSRQTNALSSQTGVVAAGILSCDNIELMPELRLAWKHDFGIDDQVITSAYAGAPSAEFSIEGQNVDRNSLLVEAGVTLFNKDGLSIPIKYAAEFRNGYTAQGIFGLIRYEF